MNTVKIGNFGEDLACKYLCDNGFTILKRNYRFTGGEIDIIAIKQKRLSFVEVKTRKDTSFGYPSDAVNYAKQKKIKQTAESFILKFSDYDEISFDVCEIYLKDKTINYIPNAFY